MNRHLLAASSPGRRMRIAFVVKNASFFVSHRLPIALAARAAGYDLTLLAGRAGSLTLEASAIRTLEAEGLPHQAIAFSSSGLNSAREFRGCVQLAMSLRRFRPDVVYCASPKGILYGRIASRLLGVRSLVLAISGMGCLFTGQSVDGSCNDAAATKPRFSSLCRGSPHNGSHTNP